MDSVDTLLLFKVLLVILLRYFENNAIFGHSLTGFSVFPGSYKRRCTMEIFYDTFFPNFHLPYSDLGPNLFSVLNDIVSVAFIVKLIQNNR
jgi:hypothetical protein